MQAQHPLYANDPGGLGIFPLIAKALMTGLVDSPSAARPAEATKPSRSSPPSPHRNWLSRLDHWFWLRQQRDVEAYLAAAVDLHDLEARIRRLEQPAPRPF
jgi:hypothetical protein